MDKPHQFPPLEGPGPFERPPTPTSPLSERPSKPPEMPSDPEMEAILAANPKLRKLREQIQGG